MKRLLTFAAAIAAAGMMSAPANAGVVDFAAYAVGNEHGVASGTSVTIDGVSMTFYAGEPYVNSDYYAYFDDYSSGRPAGLGTCRAIDINDQCVDAGDDSIDGDLGINEYVAIVFDDGPMDVTDLSFRDGEHFSLNDDDVGQLTWYIIDSLTTVLDSGVATFADVIAMAMSGYFDNIEGIAFSFVDTEFYVSAMNVVPIPGALPLLLSGLAGLGFASRRKKKIVA